MSRSVARNALVIAAAILAYLLVLSRAHLQAITIDEADNFLFFVNPPDPFHWMAASGNHVVNSLLMRLSVNIFGIHHLSVRISALIGAFLYIGAALAISLLLARKTVLKLVIMALLVYNPFVMDYLVAARGYSLALGCLLTSIAIILWSVRRTLDALPVSAARYCAIVSVLCGLGFSSSFPFAFCFALVAVFAAVLACLDLRRRGEGAAAGYLRIAAAAALPGLAVAFVLVGSVVIDFPRRELHFGATHLSILWQSVVSSLWYEPNPYLSNPLLFVALHRIASWLLPALALACAIRLAVLFTQRSDGDSRLALALFGACLLLVALLVGAHYAMLKSARILLPMERTALFFVPLSFLGICALALGPSGNAAARWSRRALLTVLVVISTYFMGCLRLGHFREWKYVCDSREIHATLARLHIPPDTKIASNWRYRSVVNFYRIMLPEARVPELTDTPERSLPKGEYPKDRDVYLCFEIDDQPFMDREGLTPIYRGKDTGAVVAVRPSFLRRDAPAPQ